MRLLALNCGSSSLKHALYELPAPSLGEPRLLDRGAAPLAGGAAGPAVERLLARLAEQGGAPDAVAHRVVHGGARFRAPALLDEPTVAAIEEAGALAPLHNEPALAAIRAVRAMLSGGERGASVPMTASFDTAFHAEMPERAALYAIPRELAERHGIRRFGFHGLAHRCLAEGAAALLDRPLGELRLVTLQLGAGCSAAAVAGGRSIDTTMGLTPLEGLAMATRSGDVDPSLATLLAEREGLSATEAVALLNERSGLLGLSGRSGDTRVLLAAEAAGDEHAALALDLFCYRVRLAIGAYLAALGGADAIVFGGGIGEHQPELRARICEGLAPLGIALDAERNATEVGGRGASIAAEGAAVAALVVPVDEERMLARDAVELLRERGLLGEGPVGR